MTPTPVAWIALFGWPLLVVAFYAARRGRASVARTTAWMLMLPILFLPQLLEVKVAGVPALDKNRLGVLSVAICIVLFHPRTLARRPRQFRFPAAILLVMLAGVAQTIRTNPDALTYGPTLLPALRAHDGISYAAGMLLDVFFPFMLGQAVFRTERDVCDLLDVLGRCLLIYAPFILFELRMSPQLHQWIYGYQQHAFLQTMRGEGYRPMVFMAHGLHLAVTLFMGYLASLTLARARWPIRPSGRSRAWIFGALLVACKSLGSILYGIAVTPIAALFSEKVKARLAVALAVIVFGYPVIRAERLLGTRGIVETIAKISASRAQSLDFRFEQENRLLAHARARPLYGWGGWSRNHLYDAWGNRTSVSDGTWVILLGIFGYVGFVGFFTLLLMPILVYARKRSRMPPRSQIVAGGLALILAFIGIDLLPNSRWDILPLVYSGALLSFTAAASARTPRMRRTMPRPITAGSPRPISIAGG